MGWIFTGWAATPQQLSSYMVTLLSAIGPCHAPSQGTLEKRCFEAVGTHF